MGKLEKNRKRGRIYSAFYTPQDPFILLRAKLRHASRKTPIHRGQIKLTGKQGTNFHLRQSTQKCRKNGGKVTLGGGIAIVFAVLQLDFFFCQHSIMTSQMDSTRPDTLKTSVT